LLDLQGRIARINMGLELPLHFSSPRIGPVLTFGHDLRDKIYVCLMPT